MAENNPLWLQEILENADLFFEDLVDPPLDDTFGWGAMYSALLDGRGNVNGTGLLITGPDGCGKHTAALHMIKLLTAGAYAVVFLDGAQWSSLDIRVVLERMELLLQYFADEGKSLCICLEGMENCSLRREILHYWGHSLTVYRHERHRFPSLFLILIDGCEETVPFLLRRQLLLCRMTPPNRELRKKLLEAKALSLKEQFSFDVFVDNTEGASYGQILDMLQNLSNLLDCRTVNEAELVAFISGQMPPVEPVRELSDVMSDFLTQLPNMLRNNSYGNEERNHNFDTSNQSTVTEDKAMENSNQYLADKRRQFEAQQPGELADDLFTKEVADEMAQKIKEQLEEEPQ